MSPVCLKGLSICNLFAKETCVLCNRVGQTIHTDRHCNTKFQKNEREFESEMFSADWAAVTAASCQARNKSTKIKFLAPETAGWGRGLPLGRGGGRKVRALPRKFFLLGFGREKLGISREFCRDVPDPWGCSKSLGIKVRANFSIPIMGRRAEKLQ